MRDNDNRAIARGCERTLRLVIGDDVLRDAGGAELRQEGMTGALHAEEHCTGKCQHEPEPAEEAAEPHKQGTEEHKDPHNGDSELIARSGREFLNLRIESVVSENACKLFCRQALFLAACWCDTRALQQVVKIFLGVRHARSTSKYVRI